MDTHLQGWESPAGEPVLSPTTKPWTGSFLSSFQFALVMFFILFVIPALALLFFAFSTMYSR